MLVAAGILAWQRSQGSIFDTTTFGLFIWGGAFIGMIAMAGLYFETIYLQVLALILIAGVIVAVVRELRIPHRMTNLRDTDGRK